MRISVVIIHRIVLLYLFVDVGVYAMAGSRLRDEYFVIIHRAGDVVGGRVGGLVCEGNVRLVHNTKADRFEF